MFFVNVNVVVVFECFYEFALVHAAVVKVVIENVVSVVSADIDINWASRTNFVEQKY